MRLRESRNSENSHKGYRTSYEVLPPDAKQCLARCDLYGDIQVTTVSIIDEHQGAWKCVPNRTFMPSKWVLQKGTTQTLTIKRRKGLKLLNPSGRSIFKIDDHVGKRTLELTNITDSKLDLALGPRSNAWHFLCDGQSIAFLERKKRAPTNPKRTRLLQDFRAFFTPSDWTLTWHDDTPPLSAPAFLAVMLLFMSLGGDGRS